MGVSVLPASRRGHADGGGPREATRFPTPSAMAPAMVKRSTHRGNGTTTAQATGGASVSLRNAPTREEIERRAFEIYLARGTRPGSPDQDWTQAERELGLR